LVINIQSIHDARSEKHRLSACPHVTTCYHWADFRYILCGASLKLVEQIKLFVEI